MSSARSSPGKEAASASAEEPPFPGPRPFSSKESSRFFGRANEVAELASLVRSHAVVLLYADSGAGKSSLIEAGLRTRMVDRFNAVVLSGRVKGPAAGGGGSGNVYVGNLLRSLGVAPEEGDVGAGLAPGLERAAWGDGPLRVVVIDQFEEVFTLFPERWSERRAFFEQIQEAIDGDPRLRFLFAMRSDYLTRLRPYTSAFVDDLRTRYGLERLRRGDAVDAVIRPSAGTSRAFSAAAAELLVGELLAIPSELPGAPAVPGEFVEPGELQIVCRDIWQRVPAGEITPDQIRTLARLDEVHRRFYDRAVTETVGATEVSESKLRRWFEDSLITPAGTRSFLFRDKTETSGLPNAVVDALEQHQVIRAEQRANSQWYELTHDRMVPAVIDSNREWFSERTKRLRRRGAIATSVVVVVALCVAIGSLFVRTDGSAPSASIPSLEDLNEGGFHLASAPEPDRIRFTASESTEAALTLIITDFVRSKPWLLRLLDPDGSEVDVAQVVGESHTEKHANLPRDGTYTLEISGGSDSYYTVIGKTAAPPLQIPLVVGVYEGSIARSDTPNLHPIADTQRGLAVVTVRSESTHFVTILDSDEGFLGSPDYEESRLSRTVLSFPGDYVLEVGMEAAGNYSVTVETPTVEPLVEGRKEATIDVGGELDVFSFESPPGRVALFRMTSTQAETQPDLRVLKPDGFEADSVLLENTPAGQSGFVAFAASENGAHFLVVGFSRNDPFGEYERQFGQAEPPATGAYQLTYITTELPP